MATYTQVGSGGVYGNGVAVCTARYVKTVSGGVYGGGAGIGGKYFPNINGSGGAYGAGAGVRSWLYDTFYSPARPTIVFKVSFLNTNTINSYPQPDSLNNLARIQAATQINIPGVAEPLKNGDQFTLYGQDALRVKKGYSSVLTVISTS